MIAQGHTILATTHPQAAGRFDVLLVEDERMSRFALSALLEASGYSTRAVRTAEEALEAVQSGVAPSVALVDLNLPGMSGLDFIEKLEQLDASVFPVLVTATGTDALRNALSRKQVAYIRKPVNFDQLLQMLASRQQDGLRSPRGSTAGSSSYTSAHDQSGGHASAS